MMVRSLSLALLGLLALFGLAATAGLAQAHEGHLHHAHMHQAATQLQDATPGVASTTASSAEMVAPSPADTGSGGLTACNGACCASGFSCCSSAMAPLPATFGPSAPRRQMVAIRAGPVGLGIDPEALPEPPKSFV